VLTQAALFLLDAVIGFFTLVLLLRFFMQVFRVSFRNQLGAFVVQLTNSVVLPLRKVLPGLFGLDLASLLLAYLLQVLLIAAVFVLRGGPEVMLSALILPILGGALLATLRLCIYLLIAALFLQAILSWVNPYSPLAGPLAQVTRPFTAPIRRVVPPIAGIDLSSLIAIILAQLVLIFL
jgi:YggT family protein